MVIDALSSPIFHTPVSSTTSNILHAKIRPLMDIDPTSKELMNMTAKVWLLPSTALCPAKPYTRLENWITVSTLPTSGVTIGDTNLQQTYASDHKADSKDHEESNHTTCMGWLLYLAKEFDSAALCKEIWHLTGVSVALVYCAIDGIHPFKASSPNPQPTALHVEIPKQSSNIDQKRIANLYSSASNIFPLGLRMHLVPVYHALTNRHAKEMCQRLQAMQQ